MLENQADDSRCRIAKLPIAPMGWGLTYARGTGIPPRSSSEERCEGRGLRYWGS
jgi:hypothetical protein